MTERLCQRRFGGLAFCLYFLERRRLVHGQAHINRHDQQHDGDNKRNAPAPVRKCGFTNQGSHPENDRQAQKQTQRCRGLNPRGVSAPLVLRRVLSHIRRRAAVLAAQRKTLQHAQCDQYHRSGDANRGITGQQPHDKGGQAHDHNGDQKGVFAPNHVAQTAKHQRTEWPHNEAGRESQQRKNESRPRVQPTEKLLGNNRSERAVQIKVIPLKHRAKR